MENPRKKPRPRRSFTPEFKAEIVDPCQHGNRLIGRVAKDFDLTEIASYAKGRARPRPTPVGMTG
ncbi:transposase [Microbispora rosea]|uniref:transposase n=1 Tax=Microbispora rosea TaxID=58117 RepID=UPI003434C2ED